MNMKKHNEGQDVQLAVSIPAVQQSTKANENHSARKSTTIAPIVLIAYSYLLVIISHLVHALYHNLHNGPHLQHIILCHPVVLIGGCVSASGPSLLGRVSASGIHFSYLNPTSWREGV